MKKSLFLLAILLPFGQVIAQKSSAWQKITDTNVARLTRVSPHQNTEGELYYALDLNTFRQSLVNATDKFSGQQGIVISFPNLNGELETFQVWENSNFTPDLQAKFPEIRAYVGKGITDNGATINFSSSPYGIETIVFRTNGSNEFMEGYDKSSTAYVLFGNKNRNGRNSFNCSTIDSPIAIDSTDLTDKTLSSAGSYKTMRLALSCTAEYANYFGATSSANQALVLTAMNNTVTRVNSVYEKDLSLHLNMVDNTNVIFYDASTDPYSVAASMANWNAELQNTLSSTLTGVGTTLAANNAAYDIGHLFGATGGGGNAGCIGCVCVADTASLTDLHKGSGITSPGIGGPLGDNFDIDYVVHEMGHQLGANHTFTFSIEGTTAQTEPGSGSTIMGYAGITANWFGDGLGFDLQMHSDPIFAYKSISQIQANLNTKTCPISTPLTGINATPVATVDGASYTIPISTAFMLHGTGTDADTSDALTYLWEENDTNTSATDGASSYVSGTKTLGPNFRTFIPRTSSSRYFPQMAKILSGNLVVATASSATWESCSSVARTLKFTFQVRDNHPGMGQTNFGTTTLTVNATGGPFAVTSQNTTGITYAGLSTQAVTWNVASTTAAPFNTANVDILLSTNVSTAVENNTNLSTAQNPTTWTTIASGVPNNGSYTVTLPNVATSTATCRFMVKAVGNVFLAVNSKNFTITPNLATDSFDLANFSLFPNPNRGDFNVQFDSTSNNDIAIAVHDLRGRIIFEKQYANTGLFSQNLQLDNVQAGIYLVTVKDGDKKVVKKIIVE